MLRWAEKNIDGIFAAAILWAIAVLFWRFYRAW